MPQNSRSYRNTEEKRGSERDGEERIKYARIFAGICLAVLIGRLGYLQIARFKKYFGDAEQQRVRTANLLPRRGTIYYSEKASGQTYPAAITRRYKTAYADPRLMEDAEGTAEKTAEIIFAFRQRDEMRRMDLLLDTGQMSREEYEEKKRQEELTDPEFKEDRDRVKKEELRNEFAGRFMDRKDPYEPLVTAYERLDEEAIKALEEAKLAGIIVRELPERYYPEETLASHALGFVRNDGFAAEGEYGIEEKMDALLRGNSGLEAREKDAAGRWISLGGKKLEPARDGADVVLTIDRVVQKTAEKIAAQGRDRYKAESATIIVMDPKTGEINALANYPDYDPNNYADIRGLDVLKNTAIADLIEPGSIFKPLVMAIALDHDLVKPQTTMVDDGPLKIGKFTINTFDGKHLGRITMTQVLEQSNNIGMAWVADKIGPERMYEGLRRFGVGELTGVSMQGEAVQTFPEPQTWSEARLSTVSFGQGVVMAPLQVLAANAALLNEGKLMEPYIVSEVRFSDGRTEKREPRQIRQVVSPETAAKVKAMLVSVVENGVAQSAQVPGYYVGGKTGTAQVAEENTGRYSADKKNITFIGFGPADNPRFAALVYLKNPEGLSFSSGTAAPMFRDLAKELFEYYRVPPDKKK